MSTELDIYIEQVIHGSVIIDLDTIKQLTLTDAIVARIWKYQTTSRLSVQEMLILMVKIQSIIISNMTNELTHAQLGRPIVIEQDGKPNMTFLPDSSMSVMDTKKYDTPCFDD